MPSSELNIVAQSADESQYRIINEEKGIKIHREILKEMIKRTSLLPALKKQKG